MWRPAQLDAWDRADAGHFLLAARLHLHPGLLLHLVQPKVRALLAYHAAATMAAQLTFPRFVPYSPTCRYTDQSVAALAFQVGQMMVRQQVRLFANIQNALANVEAMVRLQRLNASDPTQIFPVARALFGPLLRAVFFGYVARPRRRTPARGIEQAHILMLSTYRIVRAYA